MKMMSKILILTCIFMATSLYGMEKSKAQWEMEATDAVFQLSLPSRADAKRQVLRFNEAFRHVDDKQKEVLFRGALLGAQNRSEIIDELCNGLDTIKDKDTRQDLKALALQYMKTAKASEVRFGEPGSMESSTPKTSEVKSDSASGQSDSSKGDRSPDKNSSRSSSSGEGKPEPIKALYPEFEPVNFEDTSSPQAAKQLNETTHRSSTPQRQGPAVIKLTIPEANGSSSPRAATPQSGRETPTSRERTKSTGDVRAQFAALMTATVGTPKQLKRTSSGKSSNQIIPNAQNTSDARTNETVQQ